MGLLSLSTIQFGVSGRLMRDQRSQAHFVNRDYYITYDVPLQGPEDVDSSGEENTSSVVAGGKARPVHAS